MPATRTRGVDETCRVVLLQMAQYRVIAHRHAKRRHQAFRQPSAGHVSKLPDKLDNAVGTPGKRRRDDRRQLAGEGLPLA
jgi:hypothetical protein